MTENTQKSFFDKDAVKAPESKNNFTLNDGASKRYKSLVTGYGVSPDTQTDGGATRVQSLDSEIKNLTYGETDFTIYPQLINQGIVEAESTVEQYVIFRKHGKVGHSLFQGEIGISDISTPRLNQQTVNMKFLSATRQQSFASQIVGTIESADKINQLDALTTMGKTIEWAIFYGNSQLTANQNQEGYEFDGLINLVDESNFVDAKGHALTPELLNRAATLIAEGFGTPTDAYMPVGVKADFDNQFLGAQRIAMPTPQGTTVGTDVMVFNSARGSIRLNGSTVMDMENRLEDSIEVQQGAPAVPTITKAEILSDQGGKFRSEADVTSSTSSDLPYEVGNTLTYKVQAFNQKGDSLPSEEAEVKVEKATDAVKLSVQLSSVTLPDYIAIYRKGLADGEYWLIDRVAVRDMNKETGLVEFIDKNQRIPETADVFVGDVRPTNLGLMQLLPMTRLNLAQVTDATSFALLWYGALALYTPKRFSVIRNVRYSQYAPVNQSHLDGITSNGFTNVNNK